LSPLVASDNGILLGEIREHGRVIWVLSDPDVIANHAFTADGKGALFAVRMIEMLRGGKGAVIFEETTDGLLSQPAKSARFLLQFPYSIVVLQGVICVALLAWATMGRFGAPEVPPAPLLMGKVGLVTNVARLMAFAGHERLFISRYVETTLRETAHQLGAPRDLSQPEQVKWLQRVGRTRNVAGDPAEIMQKIDRLFKSRKGNELPQFTQIAREVYRWKQEILDGPSRYPRHHGGDPRRSPEGGGRPG
jgi:hypothetical protein